MELPTPTAGPSSGAWTRLQAWLLHPLGFVALLVLATFVARTRVLSTPITGVRQTQTAMISDNLSRDLAESGARAIFHPRIDYAGDGPGYLLLEFPLVNLAAVVLGGASGRLPEHAHRLPALLSFAVMLPFFFAFVRARFGTAEALLASLLVCWFPVTVQQSAEPMPEQAAATAFMVGLYFFERHVAGGRTRHLVAAAVAFALMLLIKSTSGLLLLVPAALLLRGGEQVRRSAIRHLVAGAACLVPLALWMLHASAVNATSVLDDGTPVSELVGNFVAQHGRWKLLGSARTYGEFWEMLVRAYGAWPLLLCAAGSVYGLCRRREQRALLAAWLAAFALFFVAVPWNASNHWYYTHGYATGMAVAMAVLLAPSLRFLLARVPPAARRPACALLAVLALALVVPLRWRAAPQLDRRLAAFGASLQRLVPPRALGLISSREWGIWDGALFHVSGTRGWRSLVRRAPSRRELALEDIEEKRLRGAVFLAHYGAPDELAALKPELFQALTQRYAVLETGPDWIVFSLAE